MKQLVAYVHSYKLDSIIDAVEKVGIGGLTVIQARGRGAGHRPMIETARGAGRHMAQFNSLDAVIIVVDDSKVDAVISAITGAASTGVKGDGKIFISSIDDVVDIGTKQRGPQAL